MTLVSPPHRWKPVPIATRRWAEGRSGRGLQPQPGIRPGQYLGLSASSRVAHTGTSPAGSHLLPAWPSSSGGQHVHSMDPIPRGAPRKGPEAQPFTAQVVQTPTSRRPCLGSHPRAGPPPTHAACSSEAPTRLCTGSAREPWSQGATGSRG